MVIITFSGLDGCGKSTHVQTAIRFLAARGINVQHLVSHFFSLSGLETMIRDGYQRRRSETTGNQAVSSMSGQLSNVTGVPAIADYKNSRFAYSTRLLTYPIDCFVLTLCLLLHKARGVEVVVCDRYLYDKLANLPHPDGRFARFLALLVPRPQAPIFLDVPPLVCRSRRREDSLDTDQIKYNAYKGLAQHFGLLSIVNEDARETAKEIETLLWSIIGRSDVSKACLFL